MFRYVKRYLHFSIIAAFFMAGEVIMDLVVTSLMGRIVDEGVLGLYNGGNSDLLAIRSLGFLMVFAVLCGGLSGSLNNVFSHLSAQSIGNDIRKDCFAKIMSFTFPQLEKFKAASLTVRVTNDITQLQNFVASFFRGLVRMSFMTLGSIFFMFRLSRRFGFIVLCAFPPVALLLLVFLLKASPGFYTLQRELDLLNMIMQEDIRSIRMIKACVQEEKEKTRFNKANENLVKTQLHILILFAFMNPTINALMYLVMALVLFSGAAQVADQTIAPGSVMAALTYTTQLLNGILMLVMIFQNISRGYASWMRVKEVLDSNSGFPEGNVVPDCSIRGDIEFRNVSFSYPGTGRQVLSGITLKIAAGETIAITGPTGCGKTSLINLIPRFYDVTKGCVLINGTDVRDYALAPLRRQIAVALQKSELFSGSIKENIAWANPGADPDRIRSAAETAQAADFIGTSPEGFDTFIAEQGASLSGGQKQRISIARALLKDAGILIFDDAFSALDVKTQAALLKALHEAKPDATKILVTQRVQTMRAADKIVVLENGKISGYGTHEALLASCSAYREICNSQFGGDLT